MDAFGGLFCFSSRLPCRWFRLLSLTGKVPRDFSLGRWSGLAKAPGVMTGGLFFSKTLSMSRKHNKLDETIPPAINKAAALLAERLKTSHAQVNRLLNPNHNPSLSSLSRAAAIVGRQVKLTLI